jgi:hypothetical protein
MVYSMNSCGLNWLTRVFLLMNLLEAKVLLNIIADNVTHVNVVPIMMTNERLGNFIGREGKKNQQKNHNRDITQ